MTAIKNTAPTTAGSAKALEKSLRKAVQKIAPLWPLESFVAVNPYMGLSHLSFSEAAQRLTKVGAGRMTLPVDFYLQALRKGVLSRADIAKALEELQPKGNRSVEQFLYEVENQAIELALPEVSSLTDVATAVTAEDWNQWTQDQLTSWAAVYFDQGQVAWNTTAAGSGLFQAWREEAQVNRTPDAFGLKGFRNVIKSLPNEPLAAAQKALRTLELPTVGVDLYLHRLLARVQGWAGVAAFQDWQLRLYQQKEGDVQIEFLAVLLCMEMALLESLQHTELPAKWEETRRHLLNFDVEESVDLGVADLVVLQQAYDRAAQRQLTAQFPAKTPTTKSKQAKAQAIFCIDVRSEVYRRNLEQASEDIETLGFAGFFAFPINYQPLAHGEGRAQCPVLLPAGPTVQETLADPAQHHEAVARRQGNHQLAKAWKSFKKGAVSCFAYVSPVGLSYLPKLITDSLGYTRPVPHPDQESLTAKDRKHRKLTIDNEANGLSLDQQFELGHGALKSMSLTRDFARLVLMVGHGANTVNNPHATGLDCGACGGNAGEANARVAAAVLNNPVIRERLRAQGIEIPESTWFLGCQHDTTTDEVTVFEPESVPATHTEDLREVQASLAAAARGARAERAHRLGIKANEKVDETVKARSKDWAQVRPEWGLAGCHAFVVAPRERTQGLNLQGRSFLHSYVWQQDENFQVLKGIMTAPMIVTNWINLQYFASSVDNERYGAGNKTLHNVTSGIGVLEGSAGDIRTGLPMQSVHDGQQLQHLPVRLNVIIEAPTEAMNKIIEENPNVAQLLDNEWIYLWAMDDEGKVTQRYQGSLSWATITD